MSEGDPLPSGEGKHRLLEVRVLGEIPYGEALTLQEELVRARRQGKIPDQLLLLEHPHVITLGSSSHEEHLLLSPREREARGIQLHEVGRGGDVTYHGPGQLVGYPILDLKPDRKDLHRYLRDLEEVILKALQSFGIQGYREEGLTGVWVPQGKLAAIGVRVSSGWITSHGFALNVDPDLDYFSAIVPCGIRDKPVTSMARVMDRTPAMASVRDRITESFTEVFRRVMPVV
jgi:lipoyl(octanoyl) transferase